MNGSYNHYSERYETYRKRFFKVNSLHTDAYRLEKRARLLLLLAAKIKECVSILNKMNESVAMHYTPRSNYTNPKP